MDPLVFPSPTSGPAPIYPPANPAASAARPTPSPYGRKADEDTIESARSASESANSAFEKLGQRFWNFAVGNDLSVASDSSKPWADRIFHGGLIAANLVGPEELGLKAVAKGTFVAAEHAADFAAGRMAAGAGKLVISDGVRLSKSESAIAAKLVHEGHSVVALKPSTESGVRTADFLVDGKETEFKTVSNITASDVSGKVKNVIQRATGQARDIIVDVSGQAGFTESVAAKTIARLRGGTYGMAFDSVRFIGKDFDEVYFGQAK